MSNNASVLQSVVNEPQKLNEWYIVVCKFGCDHKNEGTTESANRHKKKLHSHTRVTVSYGGGGSLFDVTFERRVTLIMNIKHAIYVYIMYVYLIYPTTNFGFLSQKCKGASMQCKMRILLGVRMCCGFVYEEMCVFVCFFSSSFIRDDRTQNGN